MALSEQEKRKIIEEERFRAQARQAQKPKSLIGRIFKLIGWGFLAIIGLSVFMVISASKNITPESQEKYRLREEEKQKEQAINGTVDFTGTKFVITNLEDKDWSSCYFQVNGKYNYPNPSKAKTSVKAGEIINLPPGELTLGDGTRFNPYISKPQRFAIFCDPDRYGAWTWN